MKRSTRLVLIALAVIAVAAAVVPLVRSREPRTLDDAARARAPGQFVSLTQGKTHYQVAGPADAPVVILVHGFSVPSYVWDPTFEALAAAGFRTVRYDLWGRGYSDRPHAVYNRELFDTQLGELMDSLHLRTPVDLVGLSMGAAIVASFTAKHPNSVRKVVLIDPSPEKVDIKALNLPLVGEYLTAALIVPSLPRQSLKNLHSPADFPDWQARFREQMRYKGFRRAILSTARHFSQEDHLPQYRALAGRKILMIWGAADAITGLSESDQLRQWLEPEFLLVENAGHVPHYERPEVVNPALIDFLKR